MGDCETVGQRSEGTYRLTIVFLLLLSSVVFRSLKMRPFSFLALHPNLAKVIPAMDHIDKYLATAALDKKFLSSIQAALAIGKRLLNKYYSSADKSELYHIAMSTYNLYDFSFIANPQRFSSPSKPQARIFRTGRLGCRMAHNRQRNSSNGVQTCICRLVFESPVRSGFLPLWPTGTRTGPTKCGLSK